MKKIFKFIKKKYCDLVVLSIISLSCLLSFFRYRISFTRSFSALKDLLSSLKYYVLSFCDQKSDITVTQLPELEVLRFLPYDVDEVIRKFKDMWGHFFDKECFLEYLRSFSVFLNNASMIVILAVPALLIFFVTVKQRIYSANDKKHGEKTKTVLLLENKAIPFFKKLKCGIGNVYMTFSSKGVYKKIFILIWLVNFNVMTILLEFFAYYFYFAFSVDLVNLPIQLVKLLLDVVIMLSGAPIVFWLFVTIFILNFFSKRFGYRCLRHREACNREFIEEQPLITMNTGSMGTGKTTLNCDMSISVEIMFREKALELMLECYSKFPNFKWILFEDWLKKLIKHRKIYNLTTCRDAVRQRKERFERTGSTASGCFGYDMKIYRRCFDDGLKLYDIFDVLEDYACLYFIYVIESSLIISNYSVRTDAALDDIGNFPLWDSELFDVSPKASYERSKYSHVIDYDAFRLGRTVVENSSCAGSFEFGVVSLSEFAKERGNQLTLQDLKKNDDSANQKNDLFIYSLKMCRHKATVMHYPFVRFITDEQRPESLGADSRDLLNIIDIQQKGSVKLLRPCFFIVDMIYEFLSARYDRFVTKRRYYRSDMTFPVWIVENAFCTFRNYYLKQYNIFGCSELKLYVKRGTMDGECRSLKYYIMPKKIYSNRFSTDCNRGFFEDRLRSSGRSIEDIPAYSDTVASFDELCSQNSYFISDMEKLKKDKK